MRVLSERGVALMLVLWLIVVLAAVAAAAVSTVRRQSDVVVNLRAAAQARAAAESGVAVTLEELRAAVAATADFADLPRVYPTVVSRLERLGEQALGDARFQVALVDLNSRIDLNSADEGTLAAFLGTFMGEGEARSLTDALIDWRDPDGVPRIRGAEAEAYAASGSGFAPPNRSLRRLEELPHIAGFTEDIAAAIAPYVTVWGDGRLNVNTATERVLAAFPGIGSQGASTVLGQRGERGVGSVLALGAQLSQGGGAVPQLVGVPQRLLIVSRGWVEGLPLTHETRAVVQLQGVTPGGVADLLLVAWEERSR
jgi:general secretion pathway protein K